MASKGFPDFEELSQQFAVAVAHYWETRKRQQKEQDARGTKDTGTRGSVVGGKQMARMEEILAELIERAGIKRPDIFHGSSLELPGYFRPEKKWDLLVVSKETLVAAIELKSQVGPSFGNNFNNRTEEAIGSASDIWLAYREGRMGAGKPRPMLGYFFLLDDCDEVHRPVAPSEPHFPVDPVFKDASYSKRYEILLRRLVLERLYDTTCLTLSSKTNKTPMCHPAADLNFKQFALSIYTNAEKFAGILK